MKKSGKLPIWRQLATMFWDCPCGYSFHVGVEICPKCGHKNPKYVDMRIIDYIDRVGPHPSSQQKAKFKKVWAELRQISQDHPVDITIHQSPTKDKS